MQREIGGYYHIYNRGVDKRTIFNEERDRWRFLQALTLFNSTENYEKTLWNLENKKEGANMKTLREFLSDKNDDPLVEIIADCLMDNHYHLLLKEITENGISKFMQKLGTSYTMYFNKKYDRSGSLFQGGYKSVKVETNKYLKYLLVYINVINPAEIVQPDLKQVGAKNIDKIMDFVADYNWSTHKECLQTRDSFIIDKDILGEIFNNSQKYKEFCKMALRSEKYKQIKHLTLE
ncbi:MAG: transposase [Patescibacteria group bacterium]